MMLPKPPRGSHLAAQHERTAGRRVVRAASKPRTYLFRGNLPAKVGAVGIDQRSFNRLAHATWKRAFGHLPWAVVIDPETEEFGGPGVRAVCGHILGTGLNPESRHAILNVCPISDGANGRMRDDLEYRAAAQATMRAWTQANEAALLAAYEIESAALAAEKGE